MGTRSSFTERAARRELRHSRSVVSTVVALCGAVVSSWIATELFLSWAGRPALVVNPELIIQHLSDPGPRTVLVSAVAGLLGLTAIALSISAARRARRRVGAACNTITIADDAVIAGALSRVAALAAHVSQAQVRTTLSRRTAHVRVTPSSGFPVSTSEVAAAVSAELAQIGTLRRVGVRDEPARQGTLA